MLTFDARTSKNLLQNHSVKSFIIMFCCQLQSWHDKLSNVSGLEGKKYYESNDMYT